MPKKRSKRTSYSLKLFLRRLKIISIVVIILGLLIGIYWFIFLSTFFQIKEINTNSELNFFPDIQKDIRSFLINKNNKFVPSFIIKIFPQFEDRKLNILLLSQKELTSYLKNKYPEIDSINFNLNLRENKLLVDVKLREISFLICHEQKCFFADKNGVLFAEAPQISGTLINTIYLINNNLQISQQIFTTEEMNIFNNIFALNNDKSIVFKVKTVQLDNPHSTTIIINTVEGWQLLMNFNSDLMNINNVLRQLFDKELSNIKNNQGRLIYIDVRDLPQLRYLLR